VNIQRWPPVAGLTGGARHFARAAHQGVASFLAVTGLVAVVFGLLYRFAAGQVPHLLQAHAALVVQGSKLLRGHQAAAPDAHRGVILLAVGAACLLVAWLIRPRAKS
jgi:hypothetical protein